MLEQVNDIYIKNDLFRIILENEEISFDLDKVKSPCKFSLERSLTEDRTVLYFYNEKYKAGIIQLLEDMCYAQRTPALANRDLDLPNGTDYIHYINNVECSLDNDLSDILLDSVDVLSSLIKEGRIVEDMTQIVVIRRDYPTDKEYIEAVNSVLDKYCDCIEVVKIYNTFKEYNDLSVATDNLTCAHEVMGYVVPYDQRCFIYDAKDIIRTLYAEASCSSSIVGADVYDLKYLSGTKIECLDWLSKTITYAKLVREYLDYLKFNRPSEV